MRAAIDMLRHMTHRMISAISVPVLAAAVLSGCTGVQAQHEAESPSTFTVSGVVAVPLANYSTQRASGLPQTAKLTEVEDGSPCVVDSGFEDLDIGAQVLVKSSEGKILGKGELGSPTVQSSIFGRCVLPFTVSDVAVQGDDLFELFAGGSSRGSVVGTEAELASGDLILRVG